LDEVLGEWCEATEFGVADDDPSAFECRRAGRIDGWTKGEFDLRVFGVVVDFLP